MNQTVNISPATTNTPLHVRANMTKEQWQQAIKFDNVDIGWIVMSIGMAVGAGIVFLPVQVGVMGLWVFLLSAVIGYPAMYLFQKLFINTLAESKKCTDYPGVISGYLGKNWGITLGILYFLMLVIWVLVYSLTVTSILFIQSLSPMVISYRSHEKSIEVARYKATRAMKIAFTILFVIVFFFAVSFTFAISQTEAKHAMELNISALAMIAHYFPGSSATIVGIVINLFAVVTSFFGVFLAFKEACRGLAMNVLERKFKTNNINTALVDKFTTVFIVLIAWGAVTLNLPILSFTSICSPIFGIVGCLIPAYLVYQVPALHKYKGTATNLIIVTGVLLCISPLLAFI